MPQLDIRFNKLQAGATLVVGLAGMLLALSEAVHISSALLGGFIALLGGLMMANPKVHIDSN